MQILDLCRKDSGKIWNRKSKGDTDGIMVKIKNSQTQQSAGETMRTIRITHVDFNRKGDAFLAADCHGLVYFFDLVKNRRPLDSKEMISTMRGHQHDAEGRGGGPIRDISAHSNGRLVVSAGERVAHLWDVMTFTHLRRLNIRADVAIAKAFFLPCSDTLITCFKDDTIFAWNTDTMEHRYELVAVNPPNQVKIQNTKDMTYKSIETETSTPNFRFRTFAASKDGKLLCAAGRCSTIHLWCLQERRQQRVIQLSPNLTVKQLLFIEHCFTDAIKILGVLTSDGIMKFVRIDTCKLIFEIGAVERATSDQRLIYAAVSSARREIAAINELGELTLYKVDRITDELSKPPIPISTFIDGLAEEKQPLRKVKVKTTPANQISLLSQQIRLAPPPPLDLPAGMNMSKLLAILKQYGEYPSKYRLFIWRSLLRIPENHSAYASLVDKGTHARYSKLSETFPLKSTKMSRVLQRVLSALAHWSPIFGEAEFLPLFVFPFVKLFENNLLVCFEIVSTLLINWSKHWFEYFPSPPINVLAMCENILAYHDKKLLSHFCRHGVTAQIYAWPLLESVFSEVLTRDEWLRLVDNLISLHPCMLLNAVVAYSITARSSLLKCKQLDDFKYFFRHRNAIDIKTMISEMYTISSTTPEDLNPMIKNDSDNQEEFQMSPGYTPLTSPSYPVFNKYPKFIVDYQVQERERIKQEEQDYISERTTAIELEQQSQKRQSEENTWCRQQDLLLKAEEKRRAIMEAEQNKLFEQRKRLDMLNRDLKVKQLTSQDETRQQFIEYQHRQRLAQITRIEDQIRYKASEYDLENKKTMATEELRMMDKKLSKGLSEKELHLQFNDERKNNELCQKQMQMLKEFQNRNEQLENTVKSLNRNLQMLQTQNDEQQVMNNNIEVEPLELPKELTTESETSYDGYNSMSDVTNDKREAYSSTSCISPRMETKDYDTKVYTSNNEAKKAFTMKILDERRECLNHSLTTNSSAQFSLDRSERDEFERGEIELMQEVRNLRHKLALNEF